MACILRDGTSCGLALGVWCSSPVPCNVVVTVEVETVYVATAGLLLAAVRGGTTCGVAVDSGRDSVDPDVIAADGALAHCGRLVFTAVLILSKTTAGDHRAGEELMSEGEEGGVVVAPRSVISSCG